MIALGFSLVIAPIVLLFGVKVWLMAQEDGWGVALAALGIVALLLGTPILGLYLIFTNV